MLNFGNKEFRNIQEQVLKNAQDIEVLKGRPLLEIKIVDELPETGEAGILYLVPVEESGEDNLYEEYVWVEGAWELIGSANIDLSNYPTLDGDNTFTGENTFSDTTHFAGVETNNIAPTTGSTYDIGADGKYFKEAKINKYTVSASGYGLEKEGSDLRINTGADIKIKSSAGDSANVCIYPYSDGKGSLGKSNIRFSNVNTSAVTNDYSALSIKGKGGVSITCDNGSSVRPSQNETLDLGSSANFWNGLYTANVYLGGNTRINKDSSNRINLHYNGNVKVKVGNTETYFANHVEPDSPDQYDLGRSGMYWRDAYIKNIINGDGNSIATNDLVTKPDYANPDVWASGKLASGTGSATIDYTDETGVGVPEWGLYMFTYGNAQCYLAFTESMWLGMLAGYPIRVACPCLEEAGGSVEGNTGNLKIEKTGTTGIIKVTVASTISGSATSTNGWDFQFIKVM